MKKLFAVMVVGGALGTVTPQAAPATPPTRVWYNARVVLIRDIHISYLRGPDAGSTARQYRRVEFTTNESVLLQRQKYGITFYSNGAGKIAYTEDNTLNAPLAGQCPPSHRFVHITATGSARFSLGAGSAAVDMFSLKAGTLSNDWDQGGQGPGCNEHQRHELWPLTETDLNHRALGSTFIVFKEKRFHLGRREFSQRQRTSKWSENDVARTHTVWTVTLQLSGCPTADHCAGRPPLPPDPPLVAPRKGKP